MYRLQASQSQGTGRGAFEPRTSITPTREVNSQRRRALARRQLAGQSGQSL